MFELKRIGAAMLIATVIATQFLFLPALAAEWSQPLLKQAREHSHTLDTAAVVILHHGKVVDQWGPVALPLRCHSVRKSILSALYGIHVEGKTIDLDTTLKSLGIDDNEPSLSDVERQSTIRNLISARSGVYHPALYETEAMAAKRPVRGSHAPDSFWYYNNWDFNAAGSIFENLTGRSVFEEFEDRIAKPLGLQDFNRSRDTEYVTGDDSVHPAYPFQISTRDLATFGQLMLQQGRWNGQQLIPQAWVEESTRSYSDAGSSGGYGYMWWVAVDGIHFPGVRLPAGTFSARGNRGQYLVVIPAWDIVICHRVNSFQQGTAVSSAEFGKLLSLILQARPESLAASDLPHPNQENTQQENAESQVTESKNTSLKPSDVALDLLIRNGQVIDGTGRERFRADIGVREGRIVAVGSLDGESAAAVIDASGKIVCPGFIDLHSHAESGLVDVDPARRSAPNLITQGITTVVVNQDGGGPLDLREQRQRMEHQGVGLNVIQTLGHGSIRGAVMANDYQRAASQAEITAMQDMLRDALAAGAFGMSAGLEYVPGRWSTLHEVESLARTVAESDGVLIVHERSSGSRPMWFLPSRDDAEQPSMIDHLRELVLIADSTRATTVATHIKARGTDFWGSSPQMNKLIEDARERGLKLFADQYPYNTSGSDGRIVLIPQWAGESGDAANPIGDPDYAKRLQRVLEDPATYQDLIRDLECEIDRRGGAENILIVEHPVTDWVGKSLADYAAKQGVDAIQAAIQLQIDGDRKRRGGCRLRAFSMSDDDVDAFACTSWTATSSDAGITLPIDGAVHPRFYGAFPRKIHRYAIERQLISIEEAVRVSTSLPAQVLRLKDRGVIRVGAAADLVVFDPQRIRDRADAFDPHQFCDGIEFVMINGHASVWNEQWLGHLAGRVLNMYQDCLEN